MKNYELTYLISPEFSEDELKKFQEKINSLIQGEGGTLTVFNSPIKKRLAYPIKKSKEAFLTTLNFYLPTEKLVNLEKKLKSEPQILHYLLLTKPQPKEIKVAPRKFVPKKAPEKKVELKEIEKKLEEILGES